MPFWMRSILSPSFEAVIAEPRPGFCQVTSLLDKIGMCDAQMLARFAERIYPTLQVIPDAQTQELAGPAGTATLGFGSTPSSSVS